jgi:hypothetical protein
VPLWKTGFVVVKNILARSQAAVPRNAQTVRQDPTDLSI